MVKCLPAERKDLTGKHFLEIYLVFLLMKNGDK